MVGHWGWGRQLERGRAAARVRSARGGQPPTLHCQRRASRDPVCSRMLLGVRSPWMTPCECRCTRAPAISRAAISTAARLGPPPGASSAPLSIASSSDPLAQNSCGGGRRGVRGALLQSLGPEGRGARAAVIHRPARTRMRLLRPPPTLTHLHDPDLVSLLIGARHACHAGAVSECGDDRGVAERARQERLEPRRLGFRLHGAIARRGADIDYFARHARPLPGRPVAAPARAGAHQRPQLHLLRCRGGGGGGVDGVAAAPCTAGAGACSECCEAAEIAAA